MLAQAVLALSLVVRVHDAYGVPADQLARARATTEAIMKGAGVAVTWPLCPCVSPVGASELVVRITRALPSTEAGALGFSLVDLGQKAGTLATVFADRVQVLAEVAAADAGELLGRVVAHEIAHLLLGTRDHASRGLMRAQWKASDLARQRPSDWVLSYADGVKIRQAISRRSSESRPLMMTAASDPVPGASVQ